MPSQLKTRAARHSSTGLFTCLVGELRGSIPTWDHILSGLQFLLPEPGIPNCHRLASGNIFLRNLSHPAWRYFRGWRQHLLEGGTISWCRPRQQMGLFPAHLKATVYNSGVSFLASNPGGPLKTPSSQSVCNGIQAGDPDIMCVDVQIRSGERVLRQLHLASVDAAPILIAELPLLLLTLS